MNYNNVIEIVFIIVPIINIKPMIRLPTLIRRIGALLGSPRINPINRLQSLKPVIPNHIRIITALHPFMNVHPTLHTIRLQPFQHRVKHQHPIVQRHRLHGPTGAQQHIPQPHHWIRPSIGVRSDLGLHHIHRPRIVEQSAPDSCSVGCVEYEGSSHGRFVAYPVAHHEGITRDPLIGGAEHRWGITHCPRIAGIVIAKDGGVVQMPQHEIVFLARESFVDVHTAALAICFDSIELVSHEEFGIIFFKSY
mmetsp:Transcript_40609/g.48743  ORF Transcript_40609/g.48743 Transcript_40609/m.48743 type:complete len:250 (+) Transcript_40609:304-1053(+)